MPSTVLGVWDTSMNKIDKDPSASGTYILDKQQDQGGQTINIINKNNMLTSLNPIGWLQLKKNNNPDNSKFDMGAEKLEFTVHCQ